MNAILDGEYSPESQDERVLLEERNRGKEQKKITECSLNIAGFFVRFIFNPILIIFTHTPLLPLILPWSFTSYNNPRGHYCEETEV